MRRKEGPGGGLPLLDLVRLGPPGRDLAAAGRLSISVGATLPVLIWLGLPQLCMFAMFGAFVGMYGRNEGRGRHVLHQLHAALMLFAAVTLGSALAFFSHSPWILICIEGIFAGLASLYADRCRLNPGGPFFGLFALGACASVPASPMWLPLAVFAVSTVVALLAGILWRPKVSLASIKQSRGRQPTSRPLQLQAGRYLCAALVAGTLGCLTGWGHAYWAVASSAVPLVVSGSRLQLQRSLHRVLGTCAGLALTLLILLPDLTGTGLVAVMIALLFPTEYLMRRNYGYALIFFTPLILLMTQLASPVPTGHLLTDRALQTLLGAAVGIAVCLALPAAPRNLLPRT